MAANADARRNWRERWLTLIYFFSNRELQAASWIKGLRLFPMWFSYGEVVCQYFDDLALDNHYQDIIIEGLISGQEFATIEPFHRALDEYASFGQKRDLPETQILQDADWSTVLRLAVQGWTTLKAIIEDPAEQALIATLENSYPMTTWVY